MNIVFETIGFPIGDELVTGGGGGGGGAAGRGGATMIVEPIGIVGPHGPAVYHDLILYLYFYILEPK